MKKRKTPNHIVKLMIGTNVQKGKDLLNKECGELIWFSNNLETVAHYYEGSVIEILVELESKKEMVYISSSKELLEEYPDRPYTYGLYETKYPVGAIWYAFNREYLMSHLKGIKEIFPDLRKYNEDYL